jgi:hypothetical protein
MRLRRRHGSCPNGGPVSCKERDSVRSTWRGTCRTGTQRDLFPCFVRGDLCVGWSLRLFFYKNELRGF